MIIPGRAFSPAKAWHLDFDGTNDGVTFSIANTATALNGASKIEASFVFRADILPASNISVLMYIINNWSGSSWNAAFTLDISSKKLRGGFRSISSDSAQIITAADDLAIEQWHRVIVKVDFTAKTAEIILNGTRAAYGSSLSFGQNVITISSGGSLANSIGYNWPGSDRYFNGQICDVSVWRNTIPNFGNKKLHGREKNLSIYYPFLDRTGTILKDWSNNKINGTITGATWEKGIFIPPPPPPIS